jgi:hypothetical protein
MGDLCRRKHGYGYGTTRGWRQFWQRRLLRAHRERPCRCRAAEQRDECATFR